MNSNSHRNKQKESIYFSDAMNKIDKRIDYNEYSEVNSSGYFKETLYNAEDEVDKMMASPLMNNYKKFRKQKLTLNLLKRNKDYIMKRLKWLNENSRQKKTIDTSKKKIKLEPLLKRLKKINKREIKNVEVKPEKNQNEKDQKINTKTVIETKYILPKVAIKKSINAEQNSKIENEDLIESGLISERKNNKEKKNILLTVSNSITKNYSLNVKNNNNKSTKSFYFTQKRIKSPNSDNIDKKQSIENMYLKCINGLEMLETYENERKKNLIISDNYKLNLDDKGIENRLYNNDNFMKKFLVENINELNHDKSAKKEEQIMKDYVQLKLKKDPILKLSEKFAYFNRKPLMTLFNFDNREEKNQNSPLAKLKVKDARIMKTLEKDNRNKNLLMKRLEEDQTKYIKGGYFIMTKENEIDNKKKKKKNIFYETNFNIRTESEFLNNIKRINPYESEQNIFL